MTLLLFNWFGYRLALDYFQQQSDLRLETRIDANNYDESQLIEIRVPLNMPYQNRWTEYERHYGEIEIDGNHYSYVKRKIAGDYLVLKCIPNSLKDVIKNAGDRQFQASSGTDQENGASQSPLAKLVKSSATDFDNYKTDFATGLIHIPNKEYIVTKVSIIHYGFKTTPEQPPDHCLFA